MGTYKNWEIFQEKISELSEGFYRVHVHVGNKIAIKNIYLYKSYEGTGTSPPETRWIEIENKTE